MHTSAPLHVLNGRFEYSTFDTVTDKLWDSINKGVSDDMGQGGGWCRRC